MDAPPYSAGDRVTVNPAFRCIADDWMNGEHIVSSVVEDDKCESGYLVSFNGGYCHHCGQTTPEHLDLDSRWFVLAPSPLPRSEK